jgi:hypothetical protein
LEFGCGHCWLIGLTDWCTVHWFRVTGFLNMTKHAGLVDWIWGVSVS